MLPQHPEPGTDATEEDASDVVQLTASLRLRPFELKVSIHFIFECRNIFSIVNLIFVVVISNHNFLKKMNLGD